MEREREKNHLQAQLSLHPEVRLYLCLDPPLAAECRNFLGAAEGPVTRAEKKIACGELEYSSLDATRWSTGGVPVEFRCQFETSQFVVDSAENFFL